MHLHWSPRVGKSSLKHFLVHNTSKAVKTSTAVMDTPEVVTISSEQYTVEGETWLSDGGGDALRHCRPLSSGEIFSKAFPGTQYTQGSQDKHCCDGHTGGALSPSHPSNTP